MSDAIKALRDYLSKSPSVVYPQDVLEYLPAIEAENAKLRERCAKTLEVGTRWMAKAARFESENTKLQELCRLYGEYISQDRCEGCVYKMRCNNGFIDECWQRSEIRDLARELGVEAE